MYEFWKLDMDISNHISINCQTDCKIIELMIIYVPNIIKKTTSHFVLHFTKFEKKIDHMKKQFSHVINFQYLFIKAGQPLLIQYLKKKYCNTEIIISHWFKWGSKWGLKKPIHFENPNRWENIGKENFETKLKMENWKKWNDQTFY